MADHLPLLKLQRMEVRAYATRNPSKHSSPNCTKWFLFPCAWPNETSHKACVVRLRNTHKYPSMVLMRNTHKYPSIFCSLAATNWEFREEGFVSKAGVNTPTIERFEGTIHTLGMPMNQSSRLAFPVESGLVPPDIGAFGFFTLMLITINFFCTIHEDHDGLDPWLRSWVANLGTLIEGVLGRGLTEEERVREEGDSPITNEAREVTIAVRAHHRPNALPPPLDHLCPRCAPAAIANSGSRPFQAPSNILTASRPDAPGV